MTDEPPIDELARKRRERELNPKPAGEYRRRGQQARSAAVMDANLQFRAGEFHAGQFVRCVILEPEPGGYTVQVEGEFHGFLPTEKQLEIGAELDVQFVCISNGRMLLTPPLTRKGQ
jgi:hypothetical protein